MLEFTRLLLSMVDDSAWLAFMLELVRLLLPTPLVLRKLLVIVLLVVVELSIELWLRVDDEDVEFVMLLDSRVVMLMADPVAFEWTAVVLSRIDLLDVSPSAVVFESVLFCMVLEFIVLDATVELIIVLLSIELDCMFDPVVVVSVRLEFATLLWFTVVFRLKLLLYAVLLSAVLLVILES